MTNDRRYSADDILFGSEGLISSTLGDVVEIEGYPIEEDIWTFLCVDSFADDQREDVEVMRVLRVLAQNDHRSWSEVLYIGAVCDA